MSTNGAASSRNGVGGAVSDVANHVKEIARLERELAVAEMSQKARSLRSVGVFGGAAALFALLAAGLGAATIAALLALVLPWWAALLITMAGFLFLASVSAMIALARARAARPLLPEAAIEETRETMQRVSSAAQ
jgi:uncharacterized membrane protein YqjE